MIWPLLEPGIAVELERVTQATRQCLGNAAHLLPESNKN